MTTKGEVLEVVREIFMLRLLICLKRRHLAYVYTDYLTPLETLTP